MSHHHAATEALAPGWWREHTWTVPQSMAERGRRALMLGLGGLALLGIGFAVGSKSAFQAYLVGYIYWLTIALGCLGLQLLHHVTRGAWGLVIRRILEAGARTLPWMALLFLPILLGIKDIYSWSNPEVMNANEYIKHKQPYLNFGFFALRAAIYFAIWCFLALRLSKLSRDQDTAPADSDIWRRMQIYAAPGVLIYCLTVTFAAFDWLMSLNPLWASTIYGAYMIVCTGLSTLAFVIVVASLLVSEQPMSRAFAPRHFHDYGKLMFAFTMLWGYLSFSQFLIIWSANLPEEIQFYLTRYKHGWQWLGLALVALHFALPFLILLSSEIKRRPERLVKVALFMLVIRFVDLYWQTAPNFQADSMLPDWRYLAAVLGVGGIWLWLFTRELSSRSLLPINAPNLAEALGHE